MLPAPFLIVGLALHECWVVFGLHNTALCFYTKRLKIFSQILSDFVTCLLAIPRGAFMFAFLRSSFPSGHSPIGSGLCIGSPISASEHYNPFTVISGLLDTSLTDLPVHVLNLEGWADLCSVWVVPIFFPHF